MSSEPYLSIVIAARNDNYGGDFDVRLQNTINWHCHQLEKRKITSEILLVDYNSIVESPSLLDRINFPPERNFVTVRVIQSGSEVHQSYLQENVRLEIPFFEFPAKNIGIRRAKGEYILSTNADILLPESIFEFIAAKNLNKLFFYRANRSDFHAFDMNDCAEELLIRHCQKHSFKLFMKGFKYDIGSFVPFRLSVFVLKIYNSLRLKYHLFKTNKKYLMDIFGFSYITHNAEYYFHTHNAGDFMLMHRNNWFNSRGNPEKTFVATHADAYMVIIAAAMGLNEFIFKDPIYHRHHERRFGWKEIEESPVYYKEYLKFQQMAQIMMKTKQPILHNDENWGAAQWELPEIVL